MNKVWLTGDAVVDLIPDGDAHYLKCPGGAPANVAVSISRLEGNCGFFGRVGQDPMGNFMAETLANENVDINRLIFEPLHRTSTVVVDLDDSGERTFTFMVKPSADQFLHVSDIPKFGQNEWLHLCSIALANEPSRSSTFEAINRLKQAGGSFSFDPNIREEVWTNPETLIPTVHQAIKLADVVKFSEEELTMLTGATTLDEGLGAIASYAIPLVVVTLGAQGTLVVFNGYKEIIPARSVQVVDTTGAGDAFVGGLLCKLSESNDWQQLETIREAVLWGNCCGGLATTQKGAMSALPKRTELIEFVG
ncbi:aminoimidazole riboside kinase [Vibrio parahaemolyticus]|uniref:aminoimidazole riboside kinase n=1 Tax=Vibrio TaxID=662 RepID=UPI000A116E8C|nr:MULTISPECIES: aminoimidazole riboside kinase [Vibrio]EJB8417603.1 aminoimidazole riboside kinase [Vibrio vulnificus]EGQ7972249.1 aminoimidazole riboside kinase [Vibrio parahaemolyticus]EGQ7976372.1 aminoimidazole riboside kinase [Vibrio parahaemolyticus]EGR1579618.1 aminoimidazole riboside kinase [Vibrio parahaemolyticus]EGR1579942.1 aminoimidazole riboside kinase [Vibrio parahaemolyticus]